MPSDPNDPSRQNSIEPNDNSDNVMNILRDYLKQYIVKNLKTV